MSSEELPEKSKQDLTGLDWINRIYGKKLISKTKLINGKQKRQRFSLEYWTFRVRYWIFS